MIKWIKWFLSPNKKPIIEEHIDFYADFLSLKKRVEDLERENILKLARIEELERENISSINAMYEISNSLEARIDMITNPVVDFGNNNGMTVEHL